MNPAKLLTVLEPLFDDLKYKGVPYTTSTKGFPAFYELYIDIFENETAGGDQVTGGRLMNRDDITADNGGIVEVYKRALAPSLDFRFGIIVRHVVGPGFGAPSVDDAMHPAVCNPFLRSAV
jgi:hypothetical protein